MILELRHVTKRFGGLTAVDKLNFSVGDKGIHAIVGPNGAGKTTLFNLISGHTPISEGEIWFKGRNITGLAPERIARLGISRTFQLTSIFPQLNVRENIWLGATARRGSNKEPKVVIEKRIDMMLERMGLTTISDAIAAELSYGQQRILDIAIALSTTPQLLLLDEPTAGLSATETGMMTKFINSLVSESSVVLVEHDMDVVAELASAATVLHNGRVLAEGAIEALLNNPLVKEVYLGDAAGQTGPSKLGGDRAGGV